MATTLAPEQTETASLRGQVAATSPASSARTRPVQLVADHPDLLNRFALGIRNLPVQVALARIDRARVRAAHRDHRVGCLDPRGPAAWGAPAEGRYRARPWPPPLPG